MHCSTWTSDDACPRRNHVPCPARPPRRRPRGRRRLLLALFDAEPAKRRPGYANFAIAEPPLKLVLLEGEPGEATRMDHLGVEVATTDEVTAATTRLAEAGLATRVEDNTTCCYAVQDKVWVTGPGVEPWEVYTVTGDARPDLEGKTELELSVVAGDGSCCRPEGRIRTPASPPLAADAPTEGRKWPFLPLGGVPWQGRGPWTSTRWPTSSTRCRRMTSSRCARSGRTRRRPRATRRWPRRSAGCPSRRRRPGSPTCWSASSGRRSRSWSSSAPAPRGAGEPGR